MKILDCVFKDTVHQNDECEIISQNKWSDNSGISDLITADEGGGAFDRVGHHVGSPATKNYVCQSIPLSAMAYRVNLLLQR